MMKPEIKSFIRDEIERYMNVILSGEAGQNTVLAETIQNLFPGQPGITNRPIMHPYGYASRAPQGTLSVVARQGEHIGNRMVLGHRDKNRPSTLKEGESAIYSLGKYEVRCFNDKIQIGKNGEFETAVVGETLAALLSSLIDHILQHNHFCSVPGAPGSTPLNAADFQADKENYVSNEKILSKDGGRF